MAKGNGTLILYMSFLCATAVTSRVRADEKKMEPPERTHSVAVIEENDFFYNIGGHNQDRHYTQGAKLIYFNGSSPKFNERVRDVWLNSTNADFGLTFGQNIYTPEDNLATKQVTGDRPYAGWLYVGLALQRHGRVFETVPVLENFELDFGVMGPEAQAGQSQNKVHEWKEIPGFDGWGNQLRSEFGFILKYGRAWKLSPSENCGRYFDVIPNIGANLGTIMISAQAGATARLGFNLPNDFGVQTIDSPLTLSTGNSRGGIGAYIFSQLEGHAVARNAFLDGNLYTDSFHVKKEPFVGNWIYGVALDLGNHLEVSYTRAVRTREFERQKGYDRIGSFTAKLKFSF
jgi:lipid A 3-O-deacylase